MKKRVATLAILSLVLLLSLSPMVSAASLLEPLDDLLLDLVPNQDLQRPNVRDNVTVFIYAAFGKVKVLEEAGGARQAISIAFGALAVVLPGVMGVIASLGMVGMIALV